HRHVNRLDAISVAEHEEIFLTAVRRRRRALDDFREIDREAFRELRAELLRDVRHLIERARAAEVEPLFDLLRAERRRYGFADRRAQLRGREIVKIGAPVIRRHWRA